MEKEKPPRTSHRPASGHGASRAGDEPAWLAFVNVSFALMILLRHILLENSAVLYPGSQHLTRIVDASMLGIIILSAALILMAGAVSPG